MNRRSLMPPDMDAEIELHMHGIPQHMREGLLAYLRYGRRPGQFLEAVLSNDLIGACARADAENQRALYEYVFVLTNYAPAAAWGTPVAFQYWLDGGRGLLLSQRDEADVDEEHAQRQADIEQSCWRNS